MRSLALLGSTGSIGTSTLDVVKAHPERLSVVALAAGRHRQVPQDPAGHPRPQRGVGDLPGNLTGAQQCLLRRRVVSFRGEGGSPQGADDRQFQRWAARADQQMFGLVQ